MRSATGFALGMLTGAVCVLLFIRLRKAVEEEEGYEELTERIADHLAELERRTAAASEMVADY